MEDIRVQEDAIVSTLYHNVRLLARANRAGCALLKILDQGFNFIPRTTLNSPPPTIRLKLPALLLSNTCLVSNSVMTIEKRIGLSRQHTHWLNLQPHTLYSQLSMKTEVF